MKFSEQIEAAVRATVFHSWLAYSWFGKASPRLRAVLSHELPSQTKRAHLLRSLQAQLYNDFYCRGFAMPERQEPLLPPSTGMTRFVGALSAANCGKGYCENGWALRNLEDGETVARKDGLELRVDRDDCVAADGAGLRFPKEFLSMSPGFYVALSDCALPEETPGNLVRFYWNLTPDGAVSFLQRATLCLNRSTLPFKIKALNDPSGFHRCDAVVLYIRKADYGSVAERMEEVYPEIAPSLNRAQPALTKPLAPGLGLAEDPGQGESFGLHRCRVLAESLLWAHENRRRSIEERLEAVGAGFERHGVRGDAPYLSFSATDDYSFRPRSRRVYAASHAQDSTEQFLRTAVEIGESLSRSAVWHEGRCNWVAWGAGETGRSSSASAAKYGALGPELYSGTSGVSWFLSELFAATGNPALRRTALGAIRQSLSRLYSVPAEARLGVHTGWAGIAYAAARAGILLQSDDLIENAGRVAKRMAARKAKVAEFDFLSGRAGALQVLLKLGRALKYPSLLELARTQGDELLRSAERAPIGSSWKSPASRERRNLTGFAHGTAGAGLALLELFAESQDSRYREAAEQAFRYERHYFDAEAGNWPDFREMPGQSRQPLSFATAWCHGAPGIALSRLRAYEILGDPLLKDEVLTGFSTTRRAVERSLASETHDFALCHGLAGNADILLEGWRVLGTDCASGRELASEVASAAVRDLARRGGPWTRRATAFETPGLMLGLAGLGYFFLRLHNPQTPCLLK